MYVCVDDELHLAVVADHEMMMEMELAEVEGRRKRTTKMSEWRIFSFQITRKTIVRPASFEYCFSSPAGVLVAAAAVVVVVA